MLKQVEIPANIHTLWILASYLKKKKRSFQRWKKMVEYIGDTTSESWSKPQVKNLCSHQKHPTSKMHPQMGIKLPFTLHNTMAVQRSESCMHNRKKTWWGSRKMISSAMSVSILCFRNSSQTINIKTII